MPWDKYERHATYAGETNDIIVTTKAICIFAKDNGVSEIEIKFQNSNGPVSIRIRKDKRKD